MKKPPFFTLLLASGLDGITRKTEPPPLFEGDMYIAESIEHVPRTLKEATERFAKSPIVRETLGQVNY